MLARHLGLAGLLASAASAAYVQYQHCDQSPARTWDKARDSEFTVASLSARIDGAEDGHHWLTWVVNLLMVDEEQCRQIRNTSAEFTVEMLTGTTNYKPEPIVTCKQVQWTKKEKAFVLSALLTEDVGHFSPLSTFHSDVRLASAHTGDSLACVQANITPEMGPAVSSAFRWAPFGLFLFVLLVSVLRSCFDRPVRLAGGDDDEAYQTPHARSTLPHVGDCLQYLQFVFLTGSLSLWYPGFYQPAVSKLNWFSLFHKGPITYGRVYPSTVDGIYEINGTYGGTYGLELMHQIVGAPATTATWVNMVITLLIIVVLTALLLECLRLGAPRPSEADAAEQTVVTSGLQYRANRVLRIILSYFTLPLIALSFYQTNNAGILPKYHTSLAVLLIVTIVATFAWLLRQIPTRSLGLLVFDAKRYQRISTSASGDQHGNAFILVIFVLAFIRGAAIGGLQISPPAQLAVLGACEVVLLACIYGFQAYPALSVGTISAVLRLATVTLMVSFLPGLANIHIKSAIGYIVLSIHGSMLLGGFLGPAVYHLVVLCARHLNAPKPDVYGLRELRRREASRTDLNRAYIDLPSPVSPIPDHGGHHVSDSKGLYDRPGSASTLHPETPHIPPSYYFRPPRPSSVRSKGSVDLQSKSGGTLRSASSLSSRAPSRTVSPLVNTAAATFGAISEQEPKYEYDVSPLRTSESSSSAPSSSDEAASSSGDSEGRPLGPRWKDYSFRESGLYYMAPRPRPAQEDVVTKPAAEPAPVRPTIRSVSSGLWGKVMGQEAAPAVQETGFQVIRPNNGLEAPPR